jgi:tetratricopeptide (TPR) repeat protein
MKLFFWLLFFLWPLALQAQISFGPASSREVLGGSSLKGEVINSDGSPVENATVLLTGVPGGVLRAITDRSGDFGFDDLSPGNYEVSTAAGNHEVRQVVVVMRGGSEITLKLDGAGPSKNGRGGSVSAQQLQVPEKARREYEKAVEQVNKHHYEKARDHIAQALDRHSCFADALALRGVLDLQAGKPEITIADAQKALQCDGSNASAYYVMGSAYNIIGRPQDALSTINEGLRFQPDAWQAYYELGKSFSQLKRYQEAIANLRRAEDLAHNTFPSIHTMLAWAFCQMRDYPQAAEEFQKFLKEDPGSPMAGQVRTLLAQMQSQMNLSAAHR